LRRPKSIVRAYHRYHQVSCGSLCLDAIVTPSWPGNVSETAYDEMDSTDVIANARSGDVLGGTARFGGVSGDDVYHVETAPGSRQS
jgi:hypothetical protein